MFSNFLFLNNEIFRSLLISKTSGIFKLKISFQLNFVVKRTDIQFSLSSHTFRFRCISTWMIFHVLQTSFIFKHTLCFYLRCVCHTQFKAIFLIWLYFSFKRSIYFIDIYVAKYVFGLYILFYHLFSVWSIFFLVFFWI